MRILIVEDEKKLCDLVERALKAERYAVDTAGDGNSGWALADAYDYDLVILDLMLPGLGGSEILRRIRRKNEQVPILILTARDATEEKVLNFELGADDYLTKPFAFAEWSCGSRRCCAADRCRGPACSGSATWRWIACRSR